MYVCAHSTEAPKNGFVRILALLDKNKKLRCPANYSKSLFHHHYWRSMWLSQIKCTSSQ